MDDDKKRFFSQDNLHKAAWGLACAGVGGLVSLAYQHFHGPSTVILDAQQAGRPPLVVTLAGQPPAPPAVAASDIKALVDAFDRFLKVQQIHEQTPDQRALLKGVESARSKIPPLTTHVEPPGSAESSAATYLPSMTGSPDEVSQYTLTNFPKFGVRPNLCPPDQAVVGSAMRLVFTVPSSFVVGDATDAYAQANIVEDSQHVTQAYAVHKPLTFGTNAIDIPTTLKPGNYQLLFGFFMKAEIRSRLPSYYSMTCPVRILPAS